MAVPLKRGLYTNITALSRLYTLVSAWRNQVNIETRWDLARRSAGCDDDRLLSDDRRDESDK